MKKILYIVIFAAMTAFAGDLSAGSLSDTQMQKFFEFSKQGKYTEAATALIEHLQSIDEQPELKASEITKYTGFLKQIYTEHGKPFGYTKWKTKSLSKNWVQSVYQVNCEKSAWMIELTEYTSPDGKSTFDAFIFATEEDVFKIYGK